MSTITERVAAGAALLDERMPDWFNRIDLDSLDVSRPCYCVVGQLAPEGHFAEAVDAGWLDLTYGVAYESGLTAVRPMHFMANDRADAIYEALTAEWKRVITERRTAA